MIVKPGRDGGRRLAYLKLAYASGTRWEVLPVREVGDPDDWQHHEMLANESVWLVPGTVDQDFGTRDLWLEPSLWRGRI